MNAAQNGAIALRKSITVALNISNFDQCGGCDLGLTNDQLVLADHAQAQARPLVQQVKIEVVIAEPPHEVLHLGTLCAQDIKFGNEAAFGVSGFTERGESVVALQPRMGKNRDQAEQNQIGRRYQDLF